LKSVTIIPNNPGRNPSMRMLVPAKASPADIMEDRSSSQYPPVYKRLILFGERASKHIRPNKCAGKVINGVKKTFSQLRFMKIRRIGTVWLKL
jgi:hypothetical protein